MIPRPSDNGEMSAKRFNLSRGDVFVPTLVRAGLERRPLRFAASLLLHEGRKVIYVARQLGHSATLTLTVYGASSTNATASRTSAPTRRSGAAREPNVALRSRSS